MISKTRTEIRAELSLSARGIKGRSSNNGTNLELMVERVGGSFESDLVHLERRKQRTRLRGRRSPLRRRMDPPGSFVILQSHNRDTRNRNCAEKKGSGREYIHLAT